MKKTVLLQISVEYDDEVTSADAVLTAFDIMMDTALTTKDLLDDLGPIDVGSFEEVIDGSKIPTEEDVLRGKSKTEAPGTA
jgi:hypothetical protein